MPDISMCLGGDCPIKTHCYRFTAEPNPYRQTYFTEPPNSMDGCKYYVRDTEDGKKKQEIDNES